MELDTDVLWNGLQHVTIHPVEIRSTALALLNDAFPIASAQSVFHYTTLDALVSIVRTQTLRATATMCLNDPSEREYACRLTRELFWEKAQSTHGLVQEIWQSYNDNERLSLRRSTIFVASFSTNGDSLPQWIAYAAGGRGAAIRFNVERLERYNVRKVAYDEAEQRSLLRRLSELYVAEIVAAAALEPRNRQLLDEIVGEFEAALDIATACCKSPHLLHEQEWRIVIPKDWAAIFPVHGTMADVRFRASHRALIPFIEIPLRGEGDISAIEGAVIGPSLDREVNTPGFALLLGADGRIESSRVPYRDTI